MQFLANRASIWAFGALLIITCFACSGEDQESSVRADAKSFHKSLKVALETKGAKVLETGAWGQVGEARDFYASYTLPKAQLEADKIGEFADDLRQTWGRYKDYDSKSSSMAGTKFSMILSKSGAHAFIDLLANDGPDQEATTVHLTIHTVN